MSSSASEFLSSIDRRQSAEQSVVLRYKDCLRFEESEVENEKFKGLLDSTSIREGLRILPLLTYRDVEVLVLDETSLMHTHTLQGHADSGRCGIRCIEFPQTFRIGNACV